MLTTTEAKNIKALREASEARKKIMDAKNQSPSLTSKEAEEIFNLKLSGVVFL